MYSFIINPYTKQKYRIKSKNGLEIFNTYLNQKGGKFIGKGTYKCAFSPPIKCKKGNKYKGTNFVSLLTTNREASYAKKNSALVKKIDPKGKFTIQYLSTCKIGSLDPIEESEKEFKNCTNLQTGNFLSNYSYPFKYYDDDDDDSLRLIIAEEGGLDLTKSLRYLQKMKPDQLLNTISNMFKSFKSIFYGIQRFCKEKYMHCDIKPANVLYHFDRDKFIIIDFELMTSFKKALKDNIFINYTINVSPFEFYYRYWPIDIGISSLLLKRLRGNMDLDYSPPISEGPTSYNTQRNPQNIRKLYYNSIKNPQKFIKNSKEKLDVYSLGITINEFFYSNTFKDLLKKLEKKNSKNTTFKKNKLIMHNMTNLVDEMTDINPITRISSSIAYKKYCAIVDIL